MQSGEIERAQRLVVSACHMVQRVSKTHEAKKTT